LSTLKSELTPFLSPATKNIKFRGKDPSADKQESLVVANDDLENAAAGEGKKDDKGSIHYGDPGYNDFLNNPEDFEEEIEDTTWGEVCRTCCCHTPKEWGRISLFMVGICFFLYFFIFALELLGTGAKVLTGCAAAGLFGDNTNPVAALIIGMLVTVLLQSSSTTTAIIVSLVGSGAITVEPAIYMVMGE
jgi:sodium-dependent phosphate cotransporter